MNYFYSTIFIIILSDSIAKSNSLTNKCIKKCHEIYFKIV